MRYVYRCTKCAKEFDVIKSLKEIDAVETCCEEPAERIIRFSGQLMGISDWDKAEFNPGLGCVTRGSKDRSRIAKERGLEEVGNTNLAKWDETNQNKRKKRIEETYNAIIPRIE